MANVLNRATKLYKTSVNTPDYDVVDWIIDPDMAAVVGYESKYWELTGDVVSLMSQVDRDAVDAAELEAENDSIADRLSVSGFDKAFALIMLDEINILRSAAGLGNRTAAQLKTALRNKL